MLNLSKQQKTNSNSSSIIKYDQIIQVKKREKAIKPFMFQNFICVKQGQEQFDSNAIEF